MEKISTLPKWTIQFLSWMQVWSIQKMSNLGWMSLSPTWIIYLKTRTALRVFSWPTVTRMPLGLCLIFWLKQKSLYLGQSWLSSWLNSLSKAMTVLRNSTTSMSSIKILRLILAMPSYLSFKQPTPSLKVSGLWLALLRAISSTQETLNLTKLPASLMRRTLLA